MENKKEMINSIIKEFERTKKDNYWKSIEEVSKITGAKKNEVVNYFETSDEFIRNSVGKYTTRGLYEKNTSFTRKLIDQINNRIK